ncbi:hypothetical protein IW136_003086 [Coemansia sp. RSA 678]|nr:hypothetical protein IW136_003086 [Coemansia sp. RSA 678]
MSNWYVSHVHPPEPPKPQHSFWCAPHDAHKCACHAPPKNESSIPADVLSGMLNQVKGIPGTHEFTFSRKVEPEKTPWQVYQDKLAEYYKTKMEQQNSRLMKEFRMLQSELPSGIVCTPQHESLTRYEAQIDGPPDTPYTNGRFLLDVVLPPRYPLDPPSIKFRTRVYHPNIDDFGNICLEVLKTGKSGCWSPLWTVGKVLIALSVLLESPNPSDPLMPEIADQITNDYRAFEETAREWTKRHAMAYGDDPEEYVRASQLEASPGDEQVGWLGEEGGEQKSESILGMARAASPSPGVSSNQLSQSPDRLSKISSKIPSQSPDQSTKLLPPVHDKLPAGGIRRLGLSRSRTGSSKKKPPQTLPGTTRFALKPLVMSRTRTSSGSSQAESVELSDDTRGEDSQVLTKQDVQVKKKRGKVAQLHSPPKRVKKGGAVRRKNGLLESESVASEESAEYIEPAVREESVESEPAVRGESVESEPVVREESVESEPRGAGSSALDFGANDSEDYECLLSPGESAGEHSSAAESKWPALSVDSCDAQTDDGHVSVAEEHVSSEQTCETTAPLQETSSGEATVEPPSNVQPDRRKGKGVDLSVRDGGHILEASHFGPLDLGLPPIRVSAQRRLMRRRARDPTH